MENFKKKYLKSSKGITLIALVITIIVLLILAGISISMLSGENSILNQASTSKNTTIRSQIIENAKVDVLGVKTENSGEITEAQFKTILNKYFSNVPEESLPDDLSSLELTTVDGGYTVLASEILSEISPDKNIVIIFLGDTSIKFTPKSNQNWYEWANDTDYTDDLDISENTEENMTLKKLIKQLYGTSDGMDSFISYKKSSGSFLYTTDLSKYKDSLSSSEQLKTIIQPGQKYYILETVW